MINFKPKFWPTFFTIPALILLLSLSAWQFYRLKIKENLIQQIEKKMSQEEINLPINVDVNGLEYRKVFLEGEFIHDKEIHVYGGTRQFKGVQGYYILTPIKLEDGRIVLVNRGWIPEKQKNPSSRVETLLTGKVKVEGVLMQNERKNLYIHENIPDKNLWFYINLPQIRNHINLPIENYYILAKEIPNSLPLGKNISAKNIYNNHLGYALTWLFSAIILVIIYYRYHINDQKN